MATASALVFFSFALVLAAFILVSVRLYQVKPQLVGKIMKYVIAIAIVSGFSVAAAVIGFRIHERHSSSYSKGMRMVKNIWGGSMVQRAPLFYHVTKKSEEYIDEKTGQTRTRLRSVNSDVAMASQKIDVEAKSNIREKGLLKFAGYNLTFKSEYTVVNPLNTVKNFNFVFYLPENSGNLSDVSVEVDGKPDTADDTFADGFEWSGVLKPGEKKTFTVQYNAQGTENFSYNIADKRMEIKDFAFTLQSDFPDYRISDGAMTPTEKNEDSKGFLLKWSAQQLITGQNISLEFVMRGNFGKTAANMFFYAPLSLFLFIGMLIITVVARGEKFHPMHVFFFTASMFVFYILGSYLISYVPVPVGIVASLAVSSGILFYYAYLLKRGKTFLQAVGVASLIFQWLFSTAFFFPAHTGFLITLGTIAAFFLLMRSTADIDWDEKW